MVSPISKPASRREKTKAAGDPPRKQIVQRVGNEIPSSEDNGGRQQGLIERRDRTAQLIQGRHELLSPAPVTRCDSRVSRRMEFLRLPLRSAHRRRVHEAAAIP